MSLLQTLLLYLSSTESSDSSVESISLPKYFISSCLKKARSPTPGISVGRPALSCLLAALSISCIVNPPSPASGVATSFLTGVRIGAYPGGGSRTLNPFTGNISSSSSSEKS
ncbi:unnamed protein product [Pneumocystis jirovecii]|uniref:Uncharacterized protein n=1 Tax=Pneumocystis jirovecii TaxID=42068 RepID=L0PHB5_PNEJI|nr:unnamed protein product [Pneumocystis jirovecii]